MPATDSQAFATSTSMPEKHGVVTDEPGILLHPESFSDEFTRMLKRAGLTRIRLHDSRHTTLSLI